MEHPSHVLKRPQWAVLLCTIALGATPGQPKQPQTSEELHGPNAKPLVTKVDLRIVQRAQKILDSPSKWNRADTRICPEDAKTFSLYCALQRATEDVSGTFEHRGAPMQQARFVIDEIAPNRQNYKHRLMGYNNDPTTTFADIQKVFRLLEDRIAKQLSNGSQRGSN